MPRGAHGQEHSPVERLRLSLHHRIGQGDKGPDGGRHQQQAEEDPQFLPAQTREEAPQMQGTGVTPASHRDPSWEVHDARGGHGPRAPCQNDETGVLGMSCSSYAATLVRWW
jgi:hypothetical protein